MLRRHCFFLCEKQDFYLCSLLHCLSCFSFFLLGMSFGDAHHVVIIFSIVIVHHVVGVHLVAIVHYVVNMHHIVTGVHHGVDLLYY